MFLYIEICYKDQATCNGNVNLLAMIVFATNTRQMVFLKKKKKTIERAVILIREELKKKL